MWIEFHDNVRTHPKTEKLAAILDIPVYAAGGLLAFLWAWAVDKAEKDGNISAFRVTHIARICRWDRSPEELLSALTESGFLDGSYDSETLCIHNWNEYAGKLHKKRELAAQRQRNHRTRERIDSNGDSNALQ